MLTSITIVKTIIGSSILIVPYTFNQLGYIFGIIIFMAALVINQFGTLVLLKAKNLSGRSNYATILFTIWKSNVSRGLGFILIFLNNVGFCNDFDKLRYRINYCLQNSHSQNTRRYSHQYWRTWRLLYPAVPDCSCFCSYLATFCDGFKNGET